MPSTKEDKARWARERNARIRAGLPQPKRGENLFKHGASRSPEHRSWLSMMTRCVWSTPEREDWHLYQGRGVKVCERWREFACFLADMGPKPTHRHTIDRYPNGDGNYEPGNCRWATPKEQARNWKNRNVLIEFRGESLTMPEWAERIGLARESLRDRLESGWPIERAFTQPAVRERLRSESGLFQAAGD